MTDTMTDILRVGSQTDILGESPVWDVREQALYWVDIRGLLIRHFDFRSAEVSAWPVPEMAGSLAVREKGGLLLALKSGIAFFDPGTGGIESVAAPEPGRPDHRFNDGKCDPRGRFWAGTMNDVTRAPEGSLYRFDGASCVEFESGITIPNSLCWSRDARTMYFADSLKRTLFAYDYDPDRGEPGNKRVFATIAEPGIPDGSTVDAEDCLWCAEYGGWKVTRFAPDGRRMRSIDLPVKQPTSCMFGGPDLDILYVTTASQRLSAEERSQQPLAGALLAMDAGVRGLPEARFAG